MFAVVEADVAPVPRVIVVPETPYGVAKNVLATVFVNTNTTDEETAVT